jgi:hypothetical protein
MSDDPASREVLDQTLSGQLVLRVDDGVLMRSERGTWMIDLKFPSESGFHSLQIPIGKHRAIDRLARELRVGEQAR